tara:strand:+ start:920 stop:1123 length:204 start_codon:yes stop_codon:yes gene_type:complete
MPFKMRGFEPHNMYKTEKANTHKEHLALKEKGFDHDPYKKDSPMNCWKTHKRKPGTKEFSKGSCIPK